MTLIALAISLLIAALGAAGIVYPAKLLAFARLFESRTGLWAAATLRVIFGLALYQSAPTSHSPDILRVVGVLIIVAGVATPMLGARRVHQMLGWCEARGPVFLRVWAGCALAAGLLLASSVVT